MALIGSGSVLLVSEAWGEPDPVNGEEEGNQGNRQTRGCTPIRALGIDAQAYSLPKAFGKEPFEVGPAATVTHCRWDSQFSSPRFRPHLGLSLHFLPPVLYFCLLFLPFLPYHTAGRKTNVDLLAIQKLTGSVWSSGDRAGSVVT